MRGEDFLRAAFSYLFIGDYQQAQAAFAKAIAANPDSAAFAFHGSVTAWRNGDKEQALAWALQAITLEPENRLYLQHYQMIRNEGSTSNPPGSDETTKRRSD